MEVLYHVAADYRLWAPDPAVLYRVNVDGTRALLLAAEAAGVARVVYTSSVGTLGLPRGRPARHGGRRPVRLEDMVGDYKRSKFLGEREAEAAAARGLPVVIVNPSAPVGPWDWKPTPTGRMLVDYLKGRMLAYLETGLNIVHVRDVARGHLLAAARGRAGERYILGHAEGNLGLRAIFERLASYTGVPAPRVRLPHGVALALGAGAEFVARLRGTEPLVAQDRRADGGQADVLRPVQGGPGAGAAPDAGGRGAPRRRRLVLGERLCAAPAPCIIGGTLRARAAGVTSRHERG